VAVFVPVDSLLEINQRMNGPKMQWEIVPLLSLRLFMIFDKVEIFNKLNGEEGEASWIYFSFGFLFFAASVMDTEQTISRKRDSWKLFKIQEVVKIFPFCFVTIVSEFYPSPSSYPFSATWPSLSISSSSSSASAFKDGETLYLAASSWKGQNPFSPWVSNNPCV
jgi:hypothetical protein